MLFGSNAETITISDIRVEWPRIYSKDTTVVPPIKKVIFNDPATIIFWADDTKTVVKVGPDDFWDPEKGFAMAYLKKAFGDRFKSTLREHIPKTEEEVEPASLTNCFRAGIESLEKICGKRRHIDEV